jgi:type VI secretion system secreted protein VgrG
VLKDGGGAIEQSNIEEIVEIKFGKDDLTDKQAKQYRKIAGNARFRVLRPKDCGCERKPKRKKHAEGKVSDTAAKAALTLLLLVLILDDMVGGEADDVLIPGVLEELGKRLAPAVSGGLTAP